MRTNKPRRPRGFTLVEMLVVIAIIGTLVAILVPTLYRVVIKARQHKIVEEMSQLHLAIESYKQKFGDYPPDCSDAALVTRHLRKAFPRHTETAAAVSALTLTPDEALVFWLSRLLDDQRQPLSGSGNPIKIFPFDESRLVDPDGNGFASYVPPDGKDAPYVYFDSRTYSAATYTSPTSDTVQPYSTATGSSANSTTFQIVSAGLDGQFTGGSSTYVFPPPPNCHPAELDNISNFSDGKIFEDHLE